jgi:hypothetical protein
MPHEDSDAIQTDLRRLLDPSPSPTRRRISITSSRFETREPPRVGVLPVLDYDSDSNKEYPSITIPARGGLEEGGATACREAPVLVIHWQPDDFSESFSGNHQGLSISSTPRGHFVYWKGLEPSQLLEFDSRLVGQSTLWRTDPRKPEGFEYSAQLHSAQHRRAATVTTASTNWQRQRQLRQLVSTRN